MNASKPPDTRAAIRRGLVMVALALGAIGLAVLALSRSDIAEEQVRELWERSSIPMLILAQVMMSLVIGFMGLRWKALLPEGDKLPTTGMAGIVASGLLLNYALPGPVGELAAAALVNRRYGVPTETALAGGINARFVGLATAGGLAGAVYLLADLPVPGEYEGLVGGAALAILIGAVFLGGISRYPGVLQRISAATVGRLAGPAGIRRLFGKLHEVVVRVAKALAAVHHLGLKRWAAAVFWSLCAHMSVTTGILIGAWGIGSDPDIAGALFTYCAATAGIVMLIAFPGGQLGWDALFLAFYSVTTGVELPDAVAITLMVRVQQLLLLVVGALALPLMGGAKDSSAESP
ncbi:MAG: flippase-like domain-containing protein [Proteobacteria bacterium]|nr:flippase-like domain-containing protein [Pseudomonadota bacterium]MCP4921402.1 flippase-like domain-containing protein [Pseudomonadota bacterium]